MSNLPTSTSPSQTYARFDLSFQLTSLKFPGNCPRGIYVQPDQSDPLLLRGVLFPPSSGPYAGAVLRFDLYWLGSERDGEELKRPLVIFDDVVNHPLVHPATHELSLSPRFASPWRPREYTLPVLLTYVRDCFGARMLQDVKDRQDWWTNADLGRLLRDNESLFVKLCSQTVSLSKDSFARSHYQAEGHQGPPSVGKGIIFPVRPGGDEEIDAIREQLSGSDAGLEPF